MDAGAVNGITAALSGAGLLVIPADAAPKGLQRLIQAEGGTCGASGYGLLNYYTPGSY